MMTTDIEFDRRVSLHFSNQDITGEKLTINNKRWIAIVWDKWNIMEEKLLSAKTLDELIVRVQEYIQGEV